MKYFELFELLKKNINYTDPVISPLPGLEVHNFTFHSCNAGKLPGEEDYLCGEHAFSFHRTGEYFNPPVTQCGVLDVHDSQIPENINFRYHIFKPAGTGMSKKVIILFHGFNEKSWYKYFPWAYDLMKETGKTVVLFPLAFHMNRAPKEWSDRHLMSEVSNARKKDYPGITCSSLINAAISTRLHTKPQRFIWSGLQSYYDVIQFIEEAKAGKHPQIDADAEYDFFAYSIGGLMAQTLMMTNKNNYFDSSRMVLFCSGSVFNRFTPVCKFIMDSETDMALYKYIIRYIDNNLKNDQWLGHFISKQHPEGWNFSSLLDYYKLSLFREELFEKIHSRVYAVALEKDSVIPAYEVMNTLKGQARNIPIRVDIDDFPYEYRHEDPFPIRSAVNDEVDRCFTKTFGKIADFLK